MPSSHLVLYVYVLAPKDLTAHTIVYTSSVLILSGWVWDGDADLSLAQNHMSHQGH